MDGAAEEQGINFRGIKKVIEESHVCKICGSPDHHGCGCEAKASASALPTIHYVQKEYFDNFIDSSNSSISGLISECGVLLELQPDECWRDKVRVNANEVTCLDCRAKLFGPAKEAQPAAVEEIESPNPVEFIKEIRAFADNQISIMQETNQAHRDIAEGIKQIVNQLISIKRALVLAQLIEGTKIYSFDLKVIPEDHRKVLIDSFNNFTEFINVD